MSDRTVQLRKCSCCKLTKPLHLFCKCSASKSGWRGTCKDCVRERSREFLLKTRGPVVPVASSRYPNSLTPYTKIIDAGGRDWTWAFIYFKSIDRYPGYLIGSDGSVYSCRESRGREWRRLSPSPNRHRNGYVSVSLRIPEGKHSTLLVHRLVLEAFIGPCPPGKEACHFPDPNPGNNSVFNLRWDTPISNKEDARILGRQISGELVSSSKLTNAQVLEAKHFRVSGLTYNQIASKYNVNPETVRRAVNGKTYSDVKTL